MVSLQIQLDETLARQLNVVCDKRGMTKDNLLRSLVVNYLNREDAALLKRLSKTNFSSLNAILAAEDEGVREF